MYKFVSFNHKITDASKIYLPAISSSSFYGRGIFTTVAIYNSKPFLWKKHWQRLIENAKKTGVDLSDFSEIAVKNSLLETIKKNNLQNGRARLTFFDESANGIWKINNDRKTDFLITTADFHQIPDRLRLTVSSFPVNSQSPLAGIKSCNYLENLLALEEVRNSGFDEAIRLNEKHEIVSAIMATVFWIQSGKIFTPPLETGALKGTTRDFILENFPVTEKRISLDGLKNSEEIFLTSAGINITAVGKLDRKKILNSDMVIEIKKCFDDFIKN